MYPDVDRSLIHNFTSVDQTVGIVDIIYSPLQTKLMRLAKQNGNRTINGLDMLIYQAAETFRLWTGFELSAETLEKITETMAIKQKDERRSDHE